MPDIGGQRFVRESLAIFSNRGFLATLAFHEDGMFIAAGDDGFQIHPTPSEHAPEASCCLRIFCETPDKGIATRRQTAGAEQPRNSAFLTFSAAVLKPFCP